MHAWGIHISSICPWYTHTSERLINNSRLPVIQHHPHEPRQIAYLHATKEQEHEAYKSNENSHKHMRAIVAGA